MKVIFVGHRDLYFGAESVLFRVIRLVKRKTKLEPLVVLPTGPDQDFRAVLATEGITAVQRRSYKLIGGSLLRCLICLVYNLPALVSLYWYYRRQQVEVVFTNTSVNILGPLLALCLGKPHYWHFHEQPTAGSFKWVPKGLFGLYRYLLARKNNTVIFISATQRQLWEAEFGFPISNSQVIYTPAVTLPQATEKMPDAGETETVRFGFLGSFTASKNILALLEAFGRLRLAYPEIPGRLVLMGAGEMEGQLLAQIAVAGLTNEVEIRPHSTDVVPFFGAIDVFVLPSHFESWGLSVLEAIEQGKAVIVTRNTGLTEILKEGMDAFFINPTENHTLYEAMERMLLNPPLRKMMSKNALETLRGLHLNESFEQQVLTLFTGVKS